LLERFNSDGSGDVIAQRKINPGSDQLAGRNFLHPGVLGQYFFSNR